MDDTAVMRDQSGSFVIVVTTDDTAKRVHVDTGRVIDGQRVITAGLTTDDRVVVEGVQRARPGLKVNPSPLTTSEEQL